MLFKLTRCLWIWVEGFDTLVIDGVGTFDISGVKNTEVIDVSGAIRGDT